MASVLKLVGQLTSGGTTLTVDFIGASSAYRVTEWSPAVATRRAGELGGRGPYNEVDEEMTVVVSGASVLAAVEDITRLLDQSTRWARGEPVYPVYLHYQPTAASAELRALLLGGEMELPPTFVLSPVVTVVDPVVLRFRRAGLWYGGETALTDATTANPEVAVVSGFAALDAAAPLRVALEGIEENKAAADGSWLLLSSAVTSGGAGFRFVVQSGESLAGGAFTSVSDSAKFARGNNVLRFTPTLAEQAYKTIVPTLASTADSTARRWAVFVNYRNNSATTSFRLRANLYHAYNASASVYIQTPVLLIPAGASNPQWAFVGMAALPDSLSRFSLEIEASAASGTLDIDDVVLMAVDYSGGDYALRVSGAVGAISLQTDLVIDAAPLTRLTPAVYIIEALTPLWLSYRGDAALHMREGCTAVAVLWLTEGHSSSTYWRALDTGNVPQNPTVRVTRIDAYLTPR